MIISVCTAYDIHQSVTSQFTILQSVAHLKGQDSSTARCLRITVLTHSSTTAVQLGGRPRATGDMKEKKVGAIIIKGQQ